MKNDAGSTKRERFILERLVGFKLESGVCWVKIRLKFKADELTTS